MDKQVHSLKFFFKMETEALFEGSASGFKEKYWGFFCCFFDKIQVLYILNSVLNLKTATHLQKNL